MTIARSPSTVTMPDSSAPYPSILTFLVTRFPQVSGETWQQRIKQGKVLNDAGVPIDPQTPYSPGRKIHYFRERDREPVIPFTETILFQNEEILVACKPHFLPVIPGGPYVNECLLNRLQEKTGNPELTPVNRIDRETAGLVLFSVKKENRGLYHDLFMHGRVEKTYQALCHYPEVQAQGEWLIENRIERGSPWFRMKVAAGAVNSRSQIKLLEVLGSTPIKEESNKIPAIVGFGSIPADVGRVQGKIARFQLTPITGKKHQLRLHLSGLGMGIINDRYYPDLQPEGDDDFDNPLQLVAQALRFDDPITGKKMEFRSERKLLW